MNIYEYVHTVFISYKYLELICVGCTWYTWARAQMKLLKVVDFSINLTV